jgi:hypothetical protein
MTVSGPPVKKKAKTNSGKAEGIRIMKWLTRVLLSLLFLSLMGCLVVLLRWGTYPDLSTTPIDSTRLDAAVYLASYADGAEVFLQNQHALAQSALNRGIDFIFNYRRQHLSSEFCQKNAVVLQESTGAGRWLWKPYLILETLKRMPEGAYLIYLDSGFVLKKNILPLLQHMGSQDIMTVHLESDIYGLLGSIVKREALIRSGCDTPACRQAPHVWAGLSFYRNSPKSRAFVKKWLSLSEDAQILLPSSGAIPEYPEFKFHHNDQSTFSITAYLMKDDIALLPHQQIHPYLAWHHRKEHDAHKSLIGQIYQDIRGIEKRLMNSKLMVKC